MGLVDRAGPGLEEQADQVAEAVRELMDAPAGSGWSTAAADDTLGRVSKVPPARRRPARTLAALSGSPRYHQYR
ncbi:hypothetical protein ACFY5H_35060, partial [Streptomyces sp. NPDC013012]